MNIYRLGNSYVDIASVGHDEMMQLGQEESYQNLINNMDVS